MLQSKLLHASNAQLTLTVTVFITVNRMFVKVHEKLLIFL